MGTNSQSRIKLFGATISPTAVSQGTADDRRQDPPAGTDPTTGPKRPDKIIPCPRCESTETKFCYFNNYNVNQPRHFCKGCQRYWTAGGALRNVPVGAGRRKNKPPGSELTQVCLFDAADSDRVEFDDAAIVADVEEWRAAEHGEFRHIFQGKRRRFGSNSQTC